MIEMYKGIVNSPVTELKESISAQATVIKVNNINAFPQGPNLAVIGTDENAETIKYATKTTNALSGCQRGVEGIAKVWNAGEKIARNFTNKDHADLIDNINEVKQRADEAFQSASSGKQALATAITGKGVVASADDTFAVLADKIEKIKKAEGNAKTQDVLSGRRFSNSEGNHVGTMPDNGGWTGEINVFGQVAIPIGYHDGSGLVTVRTRSGRTIRPGKQQQTAIQEMEMATSDIIVEGDVDLIPGNIKKGVNIFGVQGAFAGASISMTSNVSESIEPFTMDKVALPDTWYPDAVKHPRLRFPKSNGIQLTVSLHFTYTVETLDVPFIVHFGTGNLEKQTSFVAKALFPQGAEYSGTLVINEELDNFCIQFDDSYFEIKAYENILRW